MRVNAWLLIALGALLSAGCAGASRAVQPDATSRPGQEYACEPGKEHWRSQGAPVRGGALVKTAFEPGHLDVSAPSQHPGAIPQVYGHLVHPRTCYFEDLTMVPGLARSWEVSADALTWTFRLRDDMRWHNKPPVNGRPLTAADVAWTIEFVKQSGGLRSYWEDVTHREPDSRTVVLQLKEPQADFLGRLGDHQNVIFPREVQEQSGDFKKTAIGTGPFMLKEYRPGQSITLERNPDWPELAQDGRALPYMDEVRSVILSDSAAEVAAVRSGMADMGPSLGKRAYEELRQANPKLKQYQMANASVFGMFMNLSRKPFDDVRVRKAVALAIDPDDIIAANGGAAVHTGFLPTAIKDYAWTAEQAREKFRPNREAAKQLLAQAGYGAGNLPFLLKTTASYAQDTELIQKLLEAVGIRVQISVEPVANTRNILTTDNYDAAWGNPATRSFVPDRWLGSFLQTGGSENVIHLSDPGVDALSRAQTREMDPVKRRQVIDALQDRLYEIMPFVPTATRVFYELWSCRVRNMPPPSYSSNMEHLAGAWIDAAGC